MHVQIVVVINTKYKKGQNVPGSGNSGWLHLMFWDLSDVDEHTCGGQTNFYDKMSAKHPRNFAVTLADMELTMLNQGVIKVSQTS